MQRCDKDQHCTNECRSTRDRQGNTLPSGNDLRDFLQEPDIKFDIIITCYHWRNPFIEQLKDLMPIVKTTLF